MKRLAHLCLLLAVVAGAVNLPQSGSAQTTPVASQAEIDALKQSAQAARKAAQQVQDRADQWRRLAADAQATAAGTIDPANQQMWLDRAADELARAKQLDQEAAAAFARAGSDEDRAAKLQAEANASAATKAPASAPPATAAPAPAAAAAPASPPPASGAPGNPAQGAGASQPPAPVGDANPLAVKDLIGYWRYTGQDPLFVIQTPDGKPQGTALKGYSDERIWDGTVEGEVATFRYKPKAAEMNPDAPLWARKLVENKLEWRLELRRSSPCDDGWFEVRFYPGEISWRPDGEQQKDGAWVSGEGKRRDLSLERTPPPKLTFLTRPKLIVRLPQQKDAQGNPVMAVLKGQPFFVDVILPRETARQQGTALKVSVTGLRGKDSYNLELSTIPSMLRHYSALYTHAEAVVIADYGAEPNRESTLGPIPALNVGRRMALSVGNGELVEFKYGELTQQVRVFNTAIQLQLWHAGMQLEQQEKIFFALQESPKETEAARKQAGLKHLMVLNAETLLHSQKLTDIQKLAAMDFYLGNNNGVGLIWLGEGDEDYFPIDRAGKSLGTFHLLPPEKLKRNAEYDTVWTANYEPAVVVVMNQAAQVYRDAAIRTLTVQYSLAAYAIVATSTPVGDVWTVITGTDIFGNRVDTTTRFMHAIGAASQFLLLGAGTAQGLEDLNSAPGSNRMGQFVAATEELGAMEGVRLPKTLPRNVLEAFGTPKAFTPAQMGAAASAAEVQCSADAQLCEPHEIPGLPVDEVGAGGGKQPAAKPAAAGTPAAPAPVNPVATPPKGAVQPGELQFRKDFNDANYFKIMPKSARVDTGLPEMPHRQQTLQKDCFLQATLSAKETATGSAPMEYEALFDLEFNQVKSYTADAAGKTRGTVPSLEGPEIVALFDGKMGMGTHGLTEMEFMMKKGWSVVNSITPGGQGHAVHLRQIIRDVKGKISEVVIYDPWPGKNIRMSACDYRSLLRNDGSPNVFFMRFD